MIDFLCHIGVTLLYLKVIGPVVGSYPLSAVLVEISFSSVGRALTYNTGDPGIESHQGHCIFQR